MLSLMSMLGVKGTDRTAGSRFMTYGLLLVLWRWAFILCMNVVLPEPVGVGREGKWVRF